MLKKIILFLPSIILLTIMLAAFSPIPNLVSSYFYVKPDLQKTDVIVVLSGGSYPDGTLTTFTSQRVIEGVSLYKDGWSKKIIFVGNSGLNKIPDAQKMKEFALKLCVPENDILLGNNSLDTYQNILETKEIMSKNDLNTGLLVTSATHTRRSFLVVKKIGINLSPATTSVDEYRQVSVDRLILSWFEARELIALSLYKLKGWI